MLKLLLFAFLCIMIYRLVRSWLLNASGDGVKGKRPFRAKRANVEDADFVDVETETETETEAEAKAVAGGDADAPASRRQSS